MKLLALLLACFWITPHLVAQDNEDAAVLASIRKAKTAGEIATFINQHYHQPDQKVFAIYSWIISNIKYDADSIHYVILDEDNEERVTYALRRRKGVCENFAAVFTDLCLKCGIPSYAIQGYTKIGGSIANGGHVWNAAFINGQWNLYDPTWDAGYAGQGNVGFRYFKIKPEIFIQTHLPFDPLFQFLNYPVTYKEFLTGAYGKKNSNNYFNYPDSLQQFEKLDRISQYLNVEKRIQKTQWPAFRIDTKLKTLKMQVEVLTQDDDMYNYNSAVEDYNQAVQLLNAFIIYRNNQFQPAKNNVEIENDFKKIATFIASSGFRLKAVNASKAVLVLDTGDLQKKLQDLSAKLKDQESFFKNYLGEVKSDQRGLE